MGSEQATTFLADHEARPVALDCGEAMQATGLYLGRGGPRPVEVVVVRAARRPPDGRVRDAWKKRDGGRGAPVLIVVLDGDRAHLSGPSGNPEPPVFRDIPVSAAERVCAVALNEPDTDGAFRFLWSALPRAEQPILGLRNEGLLALHELRVGVPRRGDWSEACRKGAAAGTGRAEGLVRALGFTLEPMPGPATLLRAGEKRTAVAVFLDRSEQPEAAAPRFGNKSPVSYALSKADDEDLRYVIVTAGAAIRIYTVSSDVGVGRRGRSETYLELNLDLVPSDRLGYLWLLFSADALEPNGTFEDVAEASGRYAAALGKRLRERIYDGVVWRLAAAIARGRRLRKPTADSLRETYRATLVLLFRLLFVAYAEDKDLLPYRTNARYRDRSLKKIANEIRQLAAEGREFDAGTTYWEEVRRLFRAVDKGQKEWDVPVYDGGLFTPDPEVSAAGAILESVELGNDLFGPALRDLLLLETEDGTLGPVDFRSLGVREFGTIYEGLLECELSVAEEDLTTDKSGVYRPVKSKADEVVVHAGHVYLHDRSGSRKASGSYYTKDFAVTHLLEHALEPALTEHLHRLDTIGDDALAAAVFFDFRVADIAMGSGHFLVAALDWIERRLANYLARRPLPDVTAQLQRLRASAYQALGSRAGAEDIDDDQLLRRQIARRCVFGVDLNPLAVDLARLSLWIHTFVPGLPLSFLDHNLQHGNSLVGIATFNEAMSVCGDGMLFGTSTLQALLARSKEAVDRLGAMADANAAEVHQARDADREAGRDLAPLSCLLSILTAARAQPAIMEAVRYGGLADLIDDPDHIPSHALSREATEYLAPARPLHFPVAFPEVFRGDTPGFDVVLGNPPWEKLRVEEHEFWARNFPGLRALGTAKRDALLARLRRTRPDLVAIWQAERDATELLRDAVRGLPGMNTGHPDMFRAFVWRFAQVVRRSTGRIGVVLPGDAFKVAGAFPIRQEIDRRFAGVRLRFLTNKGHWLFDGVDERKLVALFVANAGGGNGSQERGGSTYELFPECHDRTAWRETPAGGFVPISQTAAREYSPTLVMPVMPRLESYEVLQQFMASPRLDAHPTLKVARVYADFETSKRDKRYWHSERADGDWPVYKGESFDVWQPDTGTYYAFTSGDEILAAAIAKRRRAPRGSPYARLSAAWREDPDTHPVLGPRIAFRDVTNRTNQRTLVAALVPSRVVTVQTAPWVLWTKPSRPPWHEGYLLGVMSSIPTDWWVRRFVEGHVDQEAFSALRVADPATCPMVARRIAELSGRLVVHDPRLAHWARSVGSGCSPTPVDEGDRLDVLAELDALVAVSLGLSEAQVVHVFETFHEAWDHRERLTLVREHWRAWEGRR